MPESTQQLIASALQLNPADRAFVANAILASLDGLDDNEQSDVRDARSDEIRSRIDDIDSGRVKTIPSTEAWKVIDSENSTPASSATGRGCDSQQTKAKDRTWFGDRSVWHKVGIVNSKRHSNALCNSQPNIGQKS